MNQKSSKIQQNGPFNSRSFSPVRRELKELRTFLFFNQHLSVRFLLLSSDTSRKLLLSTGTKSLIHTCILIKKSSIIQQNEHTSSRSLSPVRQELKELRTIDGDDNRSDTMVKQQGHLGAPGRTRIRNRYYQMSAHDVCDIDVMTHAAGSHVDMYICVSITM